MKTATKQELKDQIAYLTNENYQLRDQLSRISRREHIWRNVAISFMLMTVASLFLIGLTAG